MTAAAVSSLFEALEAQDPSGWIREKLCAALLVADMDVIGWDGLEWAIESSEEDVALTWADDETGRVPFEWLRMTGTDRTIHISTYEDDACWGLDFSGPTACTYPWVEEGSLRPRTELGFVTGPIRAVEVAFDMSAGEGRSVGLITEVLLHGQTASMHLIAAEAYSPTHWGLHDESVVVLTDPARADELRWLTPRPRWRSRFLEP